MEAGFVQYEYEGRSVLSVERVAGTLTWLATHASGLVPSYQ